MFYLDGSGPLHDQLARKIRADILNTRLRPGDRLPPSRTLALDLNVSRSTVVMAFDNLIAEGFLEARTGSGTFVAHNIAATRPARDRPRKNHGFSMTVNPRAMHLLQLYQDHADTRFSNDETIDLRTGMPLENPALLQVWRRLVSRHIRKGNISSAPSNGIEALRKAVSYYLERRRGIRVPADQIIITGGTQDAFSLIAETLLPRGSVAIIEEPHYFGLRLALERFGVNIIPAPIEPRGIGIQNLPEANNARAVFVTPSNQYPTGYNMPLAARMALLDWATRNQLVLVEDDYDSEFHFITKTVPPLFTLDQRQATLYLGTFSKMLFPSLRLGYIVAPRHLIAPLTAVKWAASLGTDRITQAALADFITEGYFERFLRQNVKELKHRQSRMKQLLQNAFSGQDDVKYRHAGMHFLLQASGISGHQSEIYVKKAEKAGLLIDSTANCYLKPPATAEFVIGYSRCPLEQFGPAVRKLKGIFGSG